MSFRAELRVKQYIMINQIAEGGMGVVWRGWDEKRKIFVAVKSVSHGLLEDPQFRHRFLDEMGRHAKLVHPNIVRMMDAFEYDGQSCCVMEYVEGRSLADLLEISPFHCLPIKQVEQIARDILAALDYTHRQGIVHRDIKPSNILLDGQGRARLIDFGIALAVGGTRRTRTGQIIGSPFYMSPEQIRTPKNIDHLSDVNSVGCVLYESLTGRPPFEGKSNRQENVDLEVKRAHVHDTPIPSRQLRQEIPAYLDNLVMTALAKEPKMRIPGCGEFARRLDNWKREPSPTQKLIIPKPKESKKLNSFLAFIAVIVIIVCVVALVAKLS